MKAKWYVFVVVLVLAALFAGVANATGETGVVVKKGDSLGSIAKAQDVTLEQLASANHIVYPYVIYVGQHLVVPDEITPIAREEPTWEQKFTNKGGWVVRGTERLDENPIVEEWLGRLKYPAPESWQTFPNVANDKVVGFNVSQGMEYGTYDSPFCWQAPCDFQVGAWEYRLVTGDYRFLNWQCETEEKNGCMLVLINVMDESYTWRNQYADNGFTLRGRYWDGDHLDFGLWGLVSHQAANMLNMPTESHPGEVLNSGAPGNSGANCGNPLGCGSVDVRVVVHAGEAIIAVAEVTALGPATD